ncbi:hypothetical protein D3C78_1899720 [compost metagenome]
MEVFTESVKVPVRQHTRLDTLTGQQERVDRYVVGNDYVIAQCLVDKSIWSDGTGRNAPKLFKRR